MLQCAPYIKNLCQTIHTWKNEDVAPLSSNGVGSSKTSPTAEEKKKEAAVTEAEEGASGEERKGSTGDAASEG